MSDIDILDSQEVLNVKWFNDVGIVTIFNGREMRTYVKKVEGKNEQDDIRDIISWGSRIYPETLKEILAFYEEGEK